MQTVKLIGMVDGLEILLAIDIKIVRAMYLMKIAMEIEQQNEMKMIIAIGIAKAVETAMPVKTETAIKWQNAY